MAYRFEGRLPLAELYANSVKYSSAREKGFTVGYKKDETAQRGPVQIRNVQIRK
jgi:hypothetical protein